MEERVCDCMRCLLILRVVDVTIPPHPSKPISSQQVDDGALPHPSIGTPDVGMDQYGMRRCAAVCAEFVLSLTLSFAHST